MKSKVSILSSWRVKVGSLEIRDLVLLKVQAARRQMVDRSTSLRAASIQAQMGAASTYNSLGGYLVVLHEGNRYLVSETKHALWRRSQPHDR